jgi:Ca2+-binding EF-hand superfamily protein
MEDEFVIHTMITIDDFEKILSLIKASIKTIDDIEEIKDQLKLYDRINSLVIQFKSEKEKQQ